MSFLQKVISDLKATPDFVTPSHTTLVKNIPHEVLKEVFKTGYSSKDTPRRSATSVLNAIYSGKKLVFVLSRAVVIDICKNDCNLPKLKRSMGDNKNYQAILSILINVFGMRVEIIGTNRRPMVLSVVNPELVTALGLDLLADLRESQMKVCVDFINSIDEFTGDKV